VTGFVLDASAVLAWCFEDEGDPEADALIERVAAQGAAVPSSWSLEVANGLVGLPLATGDRNLGAAAERVGVVLIGAAQ